MNSLIFKFALIWNFEQIEMNYWIELYWIELIWLIEWNEMNWIELKLKLKI